jgi:cell division protein FtsI (penicillin-binding protein 3)
MNAKDAVFLLENMGISTTISGRGKVKKQSIRGGLRIGENTNIYLQLGNY